MNDPGVNADVPPIINVARITGFSDAGVKSTDDGTAILEPSGGPLPVTLKSFMARLLANNQVKLNWGTSMEINCSKYIIERSADGRIFTNAGSIAGSGNTNTDRNYTFNDDVTAITSGIVYYRLKQIDIDGRSSYSKIVSVRLKKSTNDFTVSPNPFSSYVNINIEWAKNETTFVKVFNMSGKELLSKNIQLYKGTNYVPLTELSSLPAGNYFIQFNTGEGRIFKQVTKL